MSEPIAKYSRGRLNMKYVSLVIFMFILLLNVTAEINSNCLNDRALNLAAYKNSILVDFVLVNNGAENEKYSHIGGYFTYAIKLKNIGSSDFNSLIDVNVFSPSKQYTTGFDIIQKMLKPEEEYTFAPLLNSTTELKIFEFIDLGVHKIILSAPETDFFRCFGNNYVHNDNEIVYAFDPMPHWQKQVIEVQNKTLQELNSINSLVKEATNPINQIIFLLLAAGLSVLFAGRIVKKLFTAAVIWFGFIYGIFLFLLGVFFILQFAFVAVIIGLMLSFFGIWLVNEYYRKILLMNKRKELEDKVEFNSICLECNNIFKKLNNQRYCPLCKSDTIANYKEFEEIKTPLDKFFSLLVKKIKKK